MMRLTSLAARPRVRVTRSICVASSTSTTIEQSTRFLKVPDSNNNGTIRITYGAAKAGAEAKAWSVAVRIIGCNRASSRLRAAGSANTCSRRAARFSVSSVTTPGNAALMASSAAPLGAVSACEIASASTTYAPHAAKPAATIDLPEPIPPVKPTIHGRCVLATGFTARAGVAEGAAQKTK